MYICPMEKEKVAQYINQKQLFVPTDKVLVALSGGADSVALLCLLKDLGYDCEAAHTTTHHPFRYYTYSRRTAHLH